jgi:hypothetical protein
VDGSDGRIGENVGHASVKESTDTELMGIRTAASSGLM